MATTAVVYRATGKRKTSVARVVLVPGSGQVVVPRITIPDITAANR